MKGIIMHQPQHHRDISKLIDKVYGIMFDLDEILRVERREIVTDKGLFYCNNISLSHMPSEMMKFSFHFPWISQKRGWWRIQGEDMLTQTSLQHPCLKIAHLSGKVLPIIKNRKLFRNPHLTENNNVSLFDSMYGNATPQQVSCDTSTRVTGQ